ncbi:hypothetical protein LguiA_001850 [Lonicera macranthoides]
MFSREIFPAITLSFEFTLLDLSNVHQGEIRFNTCCCLNQMLGIVFEGVDDV